MRSTPILPPLLMAAMALAGLPTDTDPPKAPPVLPPTPDLHVTIAVETFHKDRGNGTYLTNRTISVLVGPLYRNASVLNEVTTLYTLEFERVSCIPYISEIPFGPHGTPFTLHHPAELVKNDTVIVGNIICTESH
ncbi:hypothetical protein F5Y09DRAFT_316988 [Xylaria sp. FL1042]|nr:hypothetical protein F5Y09DRAFT_316988 [Xylaria sp. FL1042]